MAFAQVVYGQKEKRYGRVGVEREPEVLANGAKYKERGGHGDGDELEILRVQARLVWTGGEDRRFYN